MKDRIFKQVHFFFFVTQSQFSVSSIFHNFYSNENRSSCFFYRIEHKLFKWKSIELINNKFGLIWNNSNHTKWNCDYKYIISSCSNRIIAMLINNFNIFIIHYIRLSGSFATQFRLGINKILIANANYLNAASTHILRLVQTFIDKQTNKLEKKNIN